MKAVKICLRTNQLSGVVVNYHRLNSGTVQNNRTGSWVHLGDKDTPDWLALIRGRQKQLIAVYIECKSTDGKIRPGQIEFQQKHHNGQDIYVLTIRDVATLHEFLDTVGYNSLDEWNP